MERPSLEIVILFTPSDRVERGVQGGEALSRSSKCLLHILVGKDLPPPQSHNITLDSLCFYHLPHCSPAWKIIKSLNALCWEES